MQPLEFLHILACPTCKGELTQAADDSSLRCPSCAMTYPVVGGIPVLLPQKRAATLKPQGEAA